jgi:predicted dehydrogenase
VNILIIGLGSIARKHIAAVRQFLPDSTIFALRSSVSGDEVENVQNIYEWDAITFTPDFVIISNPTLLHGEAIRRCIFFGCPLFIEKPVLSDINDADTLLQEIREKNISTYVACNLRFHPSLVFLKNYLSEKQPRINEVNVYCGSYLPDWRAGRDFKKTYSANANMGGGVHLDLIHELDYCWWLFGSPYKISSIKRNVSSLGIDAVDDASYHLLYEGYTIDVRLNYYRRDNKRTVEILTSDDTILLDINNGIVTNLFTKEILFNEPFEIMDTYHKQIAYFIGHMNLKTQPMNDLEEAIEVLKVALV